MNVCGFFLKEVHLYSNVLLQMYFATFNFQLVNATNKKKKVVKNCRRSKNYISYRNMFINYKLVLHAFV